MTERRQKLPQQIDQTGCAEHMYQSQQDNQGWDNMQEDLQPVFSACEQCAIDIAFFCQCKETDKGDKTWN